MTYYICSYDSRQAAYGPYSTALAAAQDLNQTPDPQAYCVMSLYLLRKSDLYKGKAGAEQLSRDLLAPFPPPILGQHSEEEIAHARGGFLVRFAPSPTFAAKPFWVRSRTDDLPMSTLLADWFRIAGALDRPANLKPVFAALQKCHPWLFVPATPEDLAAYPVAGKLAYGGTVSRGLLIFP